MTDYDGLVDRVRTFGVERDWKNFHDPKSLLIALMGEVGEVAELVQWLPAGEVADRVRRDPLRGRVSDELADVLIYLIQLADACAVDLVDAAEVKLGRAAVRYPIERFRGTAPERLA